MKPTPHISARPAKSGASPHRTLAYRPDIDGLRAFAVLPVLLFHVGTPGFAGGFVGVDIFFVISGFLITSIIDREMQNGTFSIVRFYERRVRRIFPAMFAMIALCVVACAFVLLPIDYRQFGSSAAAAALSVSNCLFYLQTGYFAAEADQKPLLHTWSLGIEEQFYALFPLLLLVLRRLPQAVGRLVLVSVFVASLALCVLRTPTHQAESFYLLHTRAWELLLGGLLALSQHRLRVSRLGAELASCAGAAMLLVATATYRETTVFPGYAALLPCVGTALFLCAGVEQRPFINRVTAMRPLVAIGRISYSLYLWHWPIIMLTKYYLDRPLGAVEKVLAVAAAFVMAALSFAYVESRFRGSATDLRGARLVLAKGGATVAVTVSVGLLLRLTEGMPNRLPKDAADLAAGATDTDASMVKCAWANMREVERGEFCRTDESAVPTYLVWGDSHAHMLFPAFRDAATESGVFAAFVACPPLLGLGRSRVLEDDPCYRFNRRVAEYLVDHPSIKKVVLISRWAYWADGTGFGNEGGSGDPLFDVESPNTDLPNPTAFRRGLARTLAFLAENGRSAAIVASVPEVDRSVPRSLGKPLFYRRVPPEVRTSVTTYQARQRTFRSILSDLRTDYAFTLVEPHKRLCGSSRCEVSREGRALYKDSQHLSTWGASYLRAVVAEALADPSASGPPITTTGAAAEP